MYKCPISKNLSINLFGEKLDIIKKILSTEQFKEIFKFNAIFPTIEQVKTFNKNVNSDDIAHYEQFIEKYGFINRENLINGFKKLFNSNDANLKITKDQYEQLLKSKIFETSVTFEDIPKEFSIEAQLDRLEKLDKIDVIKIGCGHGIPNLDLPMEMSQNEQNYGIKHIIMKILCSCLEKNDEDNILTVTLEGMQADIIGFDALKIEHWQILKEKLGHKVKNISDHTLFLYRVANDSSDQEVQLLPNSTQIETHKILKRECYDFIHKELLIEDGIFDFIKCKDLQLHSSIITQDVREGEWYKTCYLANDGDSYIEHMGAVDDACFLES